MQLVVDANILIAAFLRSATTRELLLDERLSLWIPEYGFTEVERVLVTPRLRRKIGGLSGDQVRFVLDQITVHVNVLSVSSYQHQLDEALRLAPHPADASYLALALHLGIPLWSNDAALKEQPVVVVYTTEEILTHLQR